jgi:putative membrane protein
MRRQNYKLLAGILAGAVGGLAGSWMMNQFQALIKKSEPERVEQEQKESDEDATVKTAAAITRTVADRELSEDEKKKAGPLVHYLYGAGIGALYGGAASRYRPTALGFGTVYAAAAWTLGDEVAVPALKLGDKPSEVPLSKHVQELAAHLVYGATLKGVRRLSVKGMDAAR